MSSTAAPPFGLRLPPELRERARQSAHKNRRSLNSEIIILIENSLQRLGASGDQDENDNDRP